MLYAYCISPSSSWLSALAARFAATDQAVKTGTGRRHRRGRTAVWSENEQNRTWAHLWLDALFLHEGPISLTAAWACWMKRCLF